MDWMFIIKGIAYAYLFLIGLALYVHFYVKKRGANYGKILLRVVTTTFAVGAIIGVIGGAAAYAGYVLVAILSIGLLIALFLPRLRRVKEANVNESANHFYLSTSINKICYKAIFFFANQKQSIIVSTKDVFRVQKIRLM